METWKPINEWYDVSDAGGIRSWRGMGKKPKRRQAPLVMKTTVHSRGYLTARMGKITKFVHRLVLEAFVGPGDGMECRHLNGNKKDNRVGNLAWGTALENANDRRVHGTASGGSMPGCRHPNSKLSRDVVRQIFVSPELTRPTARALGVSQGVVQLIRRRESYAGETADLPDVVRAKTLREYRASLAL